MSDVLKQVEEALEQLLTYVRTSNLTYTGSDFELERLIQFAAREYVASEKAAAALTALRGLEWKPIAEMGDVELNSVRVGYYSDSSWVTVPNTVYRRAELPDWITHFCRSILPTPPKREVENAG